MPLSVYYPVTTTKEIANMASGSRKIREERLTAFEGMKAIMEKIDRGEHLSVEERSDFDARNRRITELDADLKTALEGEKLAAAMRSDLDIPESAVQIDPEAARDRAFTSYLRTGDAREYRNTVAFQTLNPMAAGTAAPNFPAGPGGSAVGTAGYLVPPGFWQRLQVALKAFGGVANDFQQLNTESGQPLQWATTNPTSVIGSLLSEGAQVTTVGYDFAPGQLNAYTYTSGVQLVSMQLAEDSAFDLDGFVAARVGESLGRAQAAAVLSGSGSAAPLGIYNALGAFGLNSANGSGGYLRLSTTTASFGGVSTTSTGANSLTPDNMRAMIAAVDPAYRAQGAKFYMNDAQLLGIRSLSDSNGRPLVNLQDGVTPGAPTSIWGYEIVVDNSIPAIGAASTATTGTPAGPIFGHLQSAMVLRTVNGVTLNRLTERYADYLQVGFIGYTRWDSRSNDLRAAVSVIPNSQ